MIWVTHDGGTSWTDVTPGELGPWAKVSLMDASHTDVNTAYAAINTLRLDDIRPHIYRTRDGGETWTHITNGIPDGTNVNVVREDPVRPGLSDGKSPLILLYSTTYNLSGEKMSIPFR